MEACDLAFLVHRSTQIDQVVNNSMIVRSQNVQARDPSYLNKLANRVHDLMSRYRLNSHKSCCLGVLPSRSTTVGKDGQLGVFKTDS